MDYRGTVRILTTKPPFAWECLQNSPSRKTLSHFLEAIPDGALLHGLRAPRGRGRNDYPVHVHRLLAKAKIKPLIQNRALRKAQREKMLPDHDGNLTAARWFATRVGVVMVVHAGLALLLGATPRWAEAGRA